MFYRAGLSAGGKAGGTFLQTEAIPITDSHLGVAWKHDIYRILVKAAACEVQISIY